MYQRIVLTRIMFVIHMQNLSFCKSKFLHFVSVKNRLTSYCQGAQCKRKTEDGRTGHAHWNHTTWWHRSFYPEPFGRTSRTRFYARDKHPAQSAT